MFDMVSNAISTSLCQIRANDIDSETASDLVPVKDFRDITETFGTTDLSTLKYLQRRDIRLIVNDRIVNNIVTTVLNDISFPITKNSVDDETALQILDVLTFDEAYPTIPKTNVDSVKNITTKDLQLYVNGRVIEKVINKISNQTPIPLTLNIVDDETAKEIIKNDKFDDVDEFGYYNISALTNYQANDIRLYVNNLIVDDIIDEMYSNLLFPIIPNIPSDETCEEIVQDDEFDDVEGFSIQTIDKLIDLEQPDIRLYVNDRIVDNIVEDIFDELSLPIGQNDVLDEDIMKIIDLPINDSINELPVGFPEAISIFKAIDIQYYVNDRIADGVVDDLYNAFHLPIVPNVVTDQDIQEILEDDFVDVPVLFADADVSKLLEISYGERRISIDRHILHNKLRNILGEVVDDVPIILNDCDDETAYDIIKNDTIEDSLPVLPKSNMSPMNHYVANDIVAYVNEKNAGEVVDNILYQNEIPLVHNVPDNESVERIAQMAVEDVFNALPIGFPEPISHYQPNDIQLYVNTRVVDEVVSDIYDSFGLPLIPNTVSDEAIQEILEEEYYEDVIPSFCDFDTTFLRNIHPGERRINFNFPIDSIHILCETDLPVVPNTVYDEDVSDILNIFQPIDQMDSYQFQFDDARPLQEYHAPKEVFEYLDDVCERVMQRILKTDGLTDLPIEEQAYVEDDTADAILGNLINDARIFKSMTKPCINPLKKFQLAERPYILQPEEVLDNLLWNDVLPNMPLVPIITKKKRLIDFRDVVDDIVLDNYAHSKSNHNSSEDLNNSNSSVDMNVPYLMTSPSNPSSPSLSPHQVPSLLDTSSSNDSIHQENNSKLLDSSDMSATFDDSLQKQNKNKNYRDNNTNNLSNISNDRIDDEFEEEEEEIGNDLISSEEFSDEIDDDNSRIEKHVKIVPSPF
ncbi:hypothetical protein TRFO_09887 [Tritrichomonas foetus]|uniref:Uncharacterized protein n=1 Tax=Tritrichomonas foetus TaxID=1144522 RepID=A0A1J4JFU0_9EUKA|nr:hypothetical protein TRFO_09887 [Tritrichomonas foetus]|eukprot:OHS96507.1 hypothetical protein TRFO_09887 [Tritrichomonas foetus]